MTALVGATVGGCVTARVDSDVAGKPTDEDVQYAHVMTYYVSCSVSDECRVQYLDQSGTHASRDIVGEWDLEVGANRGIRLWIVAGAGGCPPRPVRVEIRMDGATVAEHLARAPGGSRCEWIRAETEFRLP